MIAGVDIGNDSTETTLACIKNDHVSFRASGIVSTTGTKGTNENISGIIQSLNVALNKIKLNLDDLDLILINEAAPVIGDFAMETITETIITESSMIGHNPETPGGVGVGVGETVLIENILEMPKENKYTVLISDRYDFMEAHKMINHANEQGFQIVAAIVQKNEGVLINNRIVKKIPIVDEVMHFERIPLGMQSVVEVASIGTTIDLLSNPYGIATIFELTPKETQFIVPIAKALIGNRSAVVIRTPKGEIKERKIQAGEIVVHTKNRKMTVPIDKGAESVMNVIDKSNDILDIHGEPGTNISGMFGMIKDYMKHLTFSEEIHVNDILAVDTFLPQEINGSLSGEFRLENAVGIAAMVKTDKLQMGNIANELCDQVGIEVKIGGVEGDMAVKGSLTTPGTQKPLAVIDVGAGSTDASFISHNGSVNSVHLAGAGNMVTMLINSELGLNDSSLAEEIKKYPLAKVESLFQIQHENGNIQFFNHPIETKSFARVVIVKQNELIPLLIDTTLEKVKKIRRDIKVKIIIKNALRALRKLSPTGSVRDFSNVVLVGGSALDFEVPNMLTEVLLSYNIVAGKGNIRGIEGPRNAVATGLLIDYKERGSYEQFK